MKNNNVFASKIGIILATAGSAVGLGNIWRFPTTTGENGGAAFILIYILFSLLLGIPGMLSEFIVGRESHANCVEAYGKAGGRKWWRGIGMMGVVCASIILGFYSVVAGWCIYYLYSAVTDSVLGNKEFIEQGFCSLQQSLWIPIAMSVTFVLLTHLVIVKGVQGGIEKASKLMMPILFVLLLILVIASCSLPNAWSGIEFLFKPDFSKITGKVMFEALGQAFFSISLGTACLCTYAAYFKEDTNLLKSSMQIVGIDCGVAIMAGLMIFPAAFSVGVNPDAGPSLIFLTLPNVFSVAFPHSVAYIISIVFYALLTLAALTSTISMHEIGTAVLTEEMKISRKWGATIITALCCTIGVLSSMSMTLKADGEIFGFMDNTLFSNFDSLTSNILLPLGAFFTTLLVGWVMPRERVIDELTSDGMYPWRGWMTKAFFFLVRYICPIGIATIFLKQTGVI